MLESKEANLGSPLSTGSDGSGSLAFHFMEMFGWLGHGSRALRRAMERGCRPIVSFLLTSFPYRVCLVYLLSLNSADLFSCVRQGHGEIACGSRSELGKWELLYQMTPNSLVTRQQVKLKRGLYL